MNAIAWILTYALLVALVAFGTLNQGDDSPWSFSLVGLAPIVAIGVVILFIKRNSIHTFRWMGAFHVITLWVAIRILPGYWARVTFTRDHIGAGFSEGYVGVFEPAWWHFLWAPVMTALVIAVAFQVITAFKPWAKKGAFRQ